MCGGDGGLNSLQAPAIKLDQDNPVRPKPWHPHTHPLWDNFIRSASTALKLALLSRTVANRIRLNEASNYELNLYSEQYLAIRTVRYQ